MEKLLDRWMEIVTDPKRNAYRYPGEAKAVAVEVLKQEGNNVSSASKKLGISHAALQHWAIQAGVPVRRHTSNVDKWIRRAKSRRPEIRKLFGEANAELKKHRGGYHTEEFRRIAARLHYLLSAEGIKTNTVAKELNVSHSTLDRWIKWYDGRDDIVLSSRNSVDPEPKNGSKRITLSVQGSPDGVASILSTLGSVRIQDFRIG